MYLGIIVLSLLGYLAITFVGWLETRLVPWARDADAPRAATDRSTPPSRPTR